MSFILDALKKSETDRQQQGSAEFSGVPTSDRRESAPRWLWVLGALLAINLAVLLGLLLKPGSPPAVAASSALPEEPAATSTSEEPAASGTDEFAQQVATARQNAPARAEPRPVPVENVRDDPPAPTITPSRGSTDTAALPTIHEVQANGLVSLPELHVDIHVYSEVAEDRFVFINMNKHKEGSRLAEGPLVREITPGGVVLVQNGTTFLLPRD
jgi:general secretion pathway protein B